MPKIESSREIVAKAMSAMHMRPAFLAPHYDTMALDLMAHMSADKAESEEDTQARQINAMADRYGGRRMSGEDAQRKPFAMVEGVAIIPVHGILLNRLAWGSSWVTGYSYIRRLAYLADMDPDVDGIFFDANSFGGEAAGMFELAEDIANLQKPTGMIVDTAAYSAAYGLAAAVGTIYMSPSAGVGSIGVRVMHMDYSKMLEDVGIKVELLYSGKHKIDGNPYNPLPDAVRKQFQAEIDQLRNEFATLVATNRGLPVHVVLDTEAQSYRAQDAVSLKLADHVLSPAKAFSHFLETLNGASDMSTQQQQPAAATQQQQQATQDQQQQTAAAPAAPAAQQAPAASQDNGNGAEAERARISGILSHEAAKDRPNLAKHLAFTPGMSIETAAGILATAAKETATAGANSLEAAMANASHPNVGANADGKDDAAGETQASAILNSFALATGETFSAKK